MRHRWSSLVLAAIVALASGSDAFAQARTDNDPTQPVLFSLRPEWYRVDDGAWRFQVIARYDQAMLRNRPKLGGKRGIILRFELPVVSGETPAVTSASTGLGDIYAQVLLVPHFSRRFAFVAGTGLVLPTATDTILGTGKWILAPAVLPVWFHRGVGLSLVKFQNFTSIAGDSERPDQNFLLITPTVLRTSRHGWVLLDTETKTDWRRDGRTGVKSGVQFGRAWNGLGVWIKPEVWWGPNRDGQWNLKTGIVWYRGLSAGS